MFGKTWGGRGRSVTAENDKSTGSKNRTDVGSRHKGMGLSKKLVGVCRSRVVRKLCRERLQ